jgi:hypothetical protein
MGMGDSSTLRHPDDAVEVEVDDVRGFSIVFGVSP